MMEVVCTPLDLAGVQQSRIAAKGERYSLALANVLRDPSLCLHSSCLCLCSCRSCEKKKVHIIARIVFNGLKVCKSVESL